MVTELQPFVRSAPTWFLPILNVLSSASSHGVHVAPNGALALGDRPKFQVDARWLHILYPALDRETLDNIDLDLGLRHRDPEILRRGMTNVFNGFTFEVALPQTYKALLAASNGLSLFAGHLNIFGVPRSYLGGKGDGDAYSPEPMELATANMASKPAALSPSDLAFGFYPWDGSYLYSKRDEDTVYVIQRDAQKPFWQWPSLPTMLASEVERLACLFDHSGYLKDWRVPTLPGEQEILKELPVWAR